jgi:oxaloacetate decarboxylase alpha subunit
MLSNLENQLKEQNASDKIDAVLKEIAIVQKDCGFIPLVTPTSQIVGTQAVFNVLFGRYKNLTSETADLVTGRYGALAAPANPELVKLALEKNKYDSVLTERPADKITNEYAKMAEEAKAAGAETDEDVLTFAMFPKVAPKFFKERSKGPVDSASFAVPAVAAPVKAGAGAAARYNVSVNGSPYDVVVAPAGTVAVAPAAKGGSAAPATKPGAVPAAAKSGGGAAILSPVAGTVLRYAINDGDTVKPGDNVIIIESMKMELEIKATTSGPVHFLVPTGAQVAAQQPLAEIGGSGVVLEAASEAVAAVPEVPAAVASSGGGAAILSPVAGTVLRYAVNEGDHVAVGDNVVIIESMKMELEIKATTAGSVHYLVGAGAQIASQQPLAEIQ